MSNKGRRFPADPLTPDEARGLLDAISPRYARGKRNRALIAVLWRSGLRAREACSLDLSDFRSGEPCTLRVLAPKGAARGKAPREVGLDRGTCELVLEWLATRGQHAGPLFASSTGRRLQTSYLRQLLGHLGQRAGIQRRVHPHALRHTFARDLYDEGVGIVHIQKALGHTHLATTSNYLASIGCADAAVVTAAREW